MRLIDADKIVAVAEHAYSEWNLGMAAAEGSRINRCFKMQELCKAVKGVADDCPTIDPESLRPTAHWISNSGESTNVVCSACNAISFAAYNFCPECGKKMVNAYPAGHYKKEN